MRDYIIKKYGLTESAVCTGQSHLYGIKLYCYKDDILLGCCERDGTPTKNRVNVFRHGYHLLSCFENSLVNISTSTFDKILSQRIGGVNLLEKVAP